jgi:branched-chain amino acid aminotransferase
MCLPVVPKDLFMHGIQTAIQVNAHLIPPFGAGMKLYMRPLLFGSGQQLGLHPSPEFSLVFLCSPTGSYFSGSGLNLHLETKHCRAARGGVGSVKCSGNYSVALNPLMNAKKQGYQDNLYLKLETYHEGEIGKALLQEICTANVFLVLETGEIITLSLARAVDMLIKLAIPFTVIKSRRKPNRK